MIRIMFGEIRTAVICTAVLAVLTGGVYPLLVGGIAFGLFSEKADGSLVMNRGEILGSSLIGRQFTGNAYFHGRPSAAGAGYDGTRSGGSNLGPLSGSLVATVRARVDAYRRENNLQPGLLIPADAVTTSASGLDPHISVRNALLQVPRVAGARGLSIETLRATILANTDARDLLVFGEPRVNVLMLNLELDGRDVGE